MLGENQKNTQKEKQSKAKRARMEQKGTWDSHFSNKPGKRKNENCESCRAGKSFVSFLFLFPFLLLLPGPVTSVEKNFYDVTPAAIRSGSDHSKVGGRKKQETKGTREEGETKTSGK